MGTMHAEDVETMIRRLETPPINLSPSLVESMDAVCIMSQVKVGNVSRRVIKKVVEIVKVKEKVGNAITNTPLVWDPAKDKFYFKTTSKIFEKLVNEYGVSKQKLLNEFRLRSLLLMRMYQLKIFNFKQVQDIITAYYKSPELVLRKFGII